MLGGTLDRLRDLLEAARGRLWLIPAIMTVTLAVAARALVRSEGDLFDSDIDAWWYFGGDSETARNLLATLLSGMMTMTSLVISITMVVLSVAANQLGPRLIWNFIRDWQIQAIIGLFFSTIVFVLVVMRSVGAESVPAVAVTVASALVGLCLFALLFHVHKVARSIIADTVVNQVAAELIAAVDALPAMEGAGPEPTEEITPDRRCTRLSVGRAGFVRLVEYPRLAAIGGKHDLFVRVLVRPGHFVLAGGTHLEVWHRGEIDEGCLQDIRSHVLVGSQRTPTQDLEYSVRQLVEIAERALSPGVNDPFTAITVIHRLAEAVERLTDRHLPERAVATDDRDIVRVVGAAATFDGVVDAAFNQIRQTGAGSPAVLIALASVLGKLEAVSRTPAQRDVLARHRAKVARAADRTIMDPEDRDDFGKAQLGGVERMADGAEAGRAGKTPARAGSRHATRTPDPGG